MKTKKHFRFIAAGIAATVLILASCDKKNSAPKTFAALADFKGATVASQKGAIFAQSVDRVAQNVEHQLYDALSEILSAVVNGKADAACLDMPVARYVAARNPELTVFPFPVLEDRYGFAVAKGSELGVKANEALHAIERRGTIRRLRSTWFSADESEKTLPDLTQRANFDGSAGTLRYGFEATLVPMSYLDSDGKPTGFELDIISRIAYDMNMNIDFIPMIFDDLLPKLAAEEIDMAGGSMSITEERLQKFDFVGPYMEGGIVLVIRRERFGR